MYGKIFESIYDGSLACGDWKALITFQQLIILADQDGVVDMTDIAIHRRTTIPLEIIQKGIEELLKPDPHSRSKDEDGRRLTLLDSERDWGWVIVNYEHYRKLASAAERREQNRQAQQRSRKKRQQVSAGVSNNNQESAEKSHIDIEVDSNVDIKPSKSENKFSAVDKSFAEHMVKKIKELNPGSKDPNINSWANEIRLMRERDDRDIQEIERIFNWANNDSFWRTNILSPAKLRKQFDQLSIKMNGANNGSHQQNHKPSLAERLETNRKRAIEQLNK